VAEGPACKAMGIPSSLSLLHSIAPHLSLQIGGHFASSSDKRFSCSPIRARARNLPLRVSTPRVTRNAPGPCGFLGSSRELSFLIDLQDQRGCLPGVHVSAQFLRDVPGDCSKPEVSQAHQPLVGSPRPRPLASQTITDSKAGVPFPRSSGNRRR
jgi:hypothetical protein